MEPKTAEQAWMERNSEAITTTIETMALTVKPTHYAKRTFDAIDMCAANDLNFFQGNIIKYAMRSADKDGIKDLEKMVYYAVAYMLWAKAQVAEDGGSK